MYLVLPVVHSHYTCRFVSDVKSPCTYQICGIYNVYISCDSEMSITRDVRCSNMVLGKQGCPRRQRRGAMCVRGPYSKTITYKLISMELAISRVDGEIKDSKYHIEPINMQRVAQELIS